MRKNREAAQLRRMRAQFTHQQEQSEHHHHQQQQPAESQQETQFPIDVDSTPSAVASESNASRSHSPAGRQSPEPAGAYSGPTTSQSVPGGHRDASSAASSDVEMVEEDHVSVPTGTEVAETAAEDETSAPRLGGLHQMSESAPAVVIGDEDETEMSAATEGPQTETAAAAEHPETGASRAGHFHVMSEAVLTQLDNGQETAAIIIPDDEGIETTSVSKQQETEAIVIPDDSETDAIVIPDDEAEAMVVADDLETNGRVSRGS